jgi:predicted Zn-dependent peptidase
VEANAVADGAAAPEPLQAPPSRVDTALVTGVGLASGIESTRLESGLTVVSEEMPGLRSVALGFWLGTGSIDEQPELYGASHFLEHLLFKGTGDRTAAEIAHAIESVGGDMNAFTTQEYTAFYVRVPDDQLAVALDVLSGVVWRPAFRVADLDSERRVILEEIGMRDDTPDDLVHELFAAALFPDHPLGRSVLGSRETIAGATREGIAGYHGGHYVPGNAVVAAAGNVDHAQIVELVGAQVPDGLGARPERGVPPLGPPVPITGLRRPTEQAHLVLGMRSIPRDDPDRFALSVLNQALGGGMSSRLFQEVREQRGLAYSVYSYRSAFTHTGALGIYAGTAPEQVRETLDVIGAELDRLVSDGLAEDELAAAIGNLKGSTALALETSSSRMHRIGRSELTLGEVPTVDDLVCEVEAVTADDVRRVIDRVIAPAERTLSVVGPLDPDDFA